jgi:hypothetical protein
MISLLHNYRITLAYHVYGITGAEGPWSPTVTIQAYSAEDALTILRLKLKSRGYDPDFMIQDMECA